MAPDRGRANDRDAPDSRTDRDRTTTTSNTNLSLSPTKAIPEPCSSQYPSHFTPRSLLLGLLIGLLIAFSNTYFGLQTGWVSGMSMPSALIAFAIFKLLPTSLLRTPFSPVENVLVQTVAGSVGTMPLGCGFVGVVPALEFLLGEGEGSAAINDVGIVAEGVGGQEQGQGLKLGTGRLVIWAVGVCLFGVVFAVPLRKEVIIREKLKFPSGTATALMIGVLHGEEERVSAAVETKGRGGKVNRGRRKDGDQETRGLLDDYDHDDGEDDDNTRARQSRQDNASRDHHALEIDNSSYEPPKDPSTDKSSEWKTKIRSMLLAFAFSGVYTIITYFLPLLRSLPVLGLPLARNWLWTLNPSPAYVGQGIIMGPATTAHMLFGAILGWAVLSPIAKFKGYAPGPVESWSEGSKGWIVWVSLAIMLADAGVSLGWLVVRPLVGYGRVHGPGLVERVRSRGLKGLKGMFGSGLSPARKGYAALGTSDDEDHIVGTEETSTTNGSVGTSHTRSRQRAGSNPEPDAPASQLISTRTFLISAVISTAIYYLSIHLAFPHILTPALTTLALALALLLSILGVRALGETDLNPVSGISKLTQLVFALIVPSPSSNAIPINLIAGGVSESGALQAGDLLQDLKTGHLLGASPAAQFYGQLVGSVFGAVASALIYRLYTRVYTIPSQLFQVPTAYVWVFTARLVTGKGVPEMAAPVAYVFAGVWALLTVVRLGLKAKERSEKFVPFVPGGIAVAVGMYNTPSFTLARAVGGLVAWWWVSWRGREETGVIVLASGLILGEGVGSIVNLGLASARAPQLGGGWV